MSVRYTAVARMEEAGAPRKVEIDIDHWRDKIELRLDNRQVFFLFFGSAIVACMLFVLGVMVGKRIETRGQAQAPELSDPLAALDRAHQLPAIAAPASAPAKAIQEGQQPLGFPSALIGSVSTPKPAVARPTKTPIAAKPATVAAPKTVALVAPKPVAPAAPPKPIALATTAKPLAAAPKPIPPAVAPAPVAQVAHDDAAKAKGKYTLHLTTFATAEEASLFAKRFPGAFVVAGDVPGKGMSYRVRSGNFGSYKEATAAKESFEKQHNTIALVAAR
jgi:DedD protein